MRIHSNYSLFPSTLDNVFRFLTNHDKVLFTSAGISVARGIVSALAILIVDEAYMVVKTAGSVISSALKKEKK